MKNKNFLLITPAIAVFSFLFVLPFIYFFFISLWKIKFYKLIKDFVEIEDTSSIIVKGKADELLVHKVAQLLPI